MPNRAAVAMQLTLCKPATRGQVRITDADPLSAPAIDHQFLADRRDLDTMIAGCKVLTTLFEHPRFQGTVVENCNPPVNPTDEAGWEAFVRDNMRVAYHHAGTCRMGPESDPRTVVDSRLRVIGVDRLRVVDASVMPVVCRAPTPTSRRSRSARRPPR
jgi:choline dehydrogenase